MPPNIPVEEGTDILLENVLDGDEPTGVHSSRIHEEVVGTCEKGRHIRGDEDRAAVLGAFRDALVVPYLHACAFHALGAYGHTDPQPAVVAWPRRPRHHLRPSPRGSFRCVYLPLFHNIAFPRQRVAENIENCVRNLDWGKHIRNNLVSTHLPSGTD